MNKWFDKLSKETNVLNDDKNNVLIWNYELKIRCVK